MRARDIQWPSNRRLPGQPGYTLLEMLVVMLLIATLATLAVPSFHRLIAAEALDVGIREFSNHLVLARSEAIAKRLPVRVVLATGWPEIDGRLRRYSLWQWEPERAGFARSTKWLSLPPGVIFEAAKPDYLGKTPAARNDPAAIRGDYPLDHGPAAFDLSGTGEEGAIAAQFVEFLPTGAARVPEGVEPHLIFVLVEGFLEEGENGGRRLVRIGAQTGGDPANWAQVNLETLTGRARILRP